MKHLTLRSLRSAVGVVQQDVYLFSGSIRDNISYGKPDASDAEIEEAERYIQQSLDRLSRGRTTIVIAHRLSTIRNADEIVVIAEDGIAEQGTHDELLAKDGVYARYYRMQFEEAPQTAAE